MFYFKLEDHIPLFILFCVTIVIFMTGLIYYTLVSTTCKLVSESKEEIKFYCDPEFVLPVTKDCQKMPFKSRVYYTCKK